MLNDILTVARKELKEIMVQRGSMRSGLTYMLIVLGIMGVLFPLQTGAAWVKSPLSIITTIWLPLLMSMGLIADSFAGERERHTLETLLATRLTDQAILFGKISAAMTYTMSLSIAGALLGAVTVNLQYPGSGFYTPPVFAGLLIFCFLGSLLVSAMGVLVSLRAENVRQAYQRMSIGYLALVLPLAFIPQFLPEAMRMRLDAWLTQLNAAQVTIGLGLAMALICGILLVSCLTHFQRSRLIAD